MSEAKTGFNFLALLFAPYYYAGYGKVGQGALMAVIGIIPLTYIPVGIYAGVKANKELPANDGEFEWPKALMIVSINLIVAVIIISM